MRKKLLSMVMAGTLALSFTACGGSSSTDTEKNTDTASTTETQTEDSKTASDKKSITIWVEKIFSDDANTKMEERLKEYEKEKDVTVNCEMVAATDFVTKLNAAIEAGQSVPDIISADTTKVLNYYPNIPCNDVTDLVNKINEERPYLQASYDGTKIDDKYYYVPFYSSSTLMFIRKDKFEEAGITKMPETWDEVFEDAKKVSDPDNDFYGLAMGCGENDDDDENTIRQYMWNEGGYLFNEDGEIVADDKVIAVFDKYAELYKDKVIPQDATTWDAGGNNGSYLAGRTAICFNAPTLYNALVSDEQYKELLDNTVVLAPPAGKENSVYMNFNRGFAVMNTCKDTDLASDVISYLLDKDWYDSYMEEIAPVFAPVFEDAKENTTWKDNEVNAQALKYVENASGYYGYPVKTIKGRTVAAKHYFTYPFVKAVNQVATGTADSSEALKSMTAAIEDFQDQVGE